MSAPLRVVGAGLGRTGTNSLKLALERLLGGPCYHMFELMERPQDVPVWRAALRGDPPDWGAFLAGYDAAVDAPASSFWAELAAANPQALVLLSVRDSPETWWASFETAIVSSLAKPVPPGRPDWERRRELTFDLMERLTPRWREPEAAMAAYERHNQRVCQEIAPERLLVWRPGDGWEPICVALGLPVPDEPFPRTNSAAEFRAAHHPPDTD